MLLPAASLWAQLAPPNEEGVALGHVHLSVADVDANRKLWFTLGGTPGNKVSANDAIRFPGILILLRKAEPSAGSEGSVIDHIAFKVPSVRNSMTKWKAAGLTTQPGSDAHQGFVITPDNLKIEITEDPSLTVPIALDHIHFTIAKGGQDGPGSVAEMEAWYVKVFGAVPKSGSQVATAGVPGGNLMFSTAPAATAPTKGRTLEHIGFEITNLEAFYTRKKANGVTFNDEYRFKNGFGAVHLTDPWGTYIELTEGQRQY